MLRFTTAREIEDASGSVVAISIAFSLVHPPLTLTLDQADVLYRTLRWWRARRSKLKGRYRLKGRVCEVADCDSQIDDRSKRCYDHRFVK